MASNEWTIEWCCSVNDGLFSNRRAFLRLSSGALLGSLAGCSALSSQSPTLDVTVLNHTNSPYTIEMDFFRNDGERSDSDARVYDTRIDVPAEGEAHRKNVTEPRLYIVQYSVYKENSRLTDQDHVHYYPDDNGNDNLAFDIHSPGTLTRR